MLSFLLPLAVWCTVSYVPWIWHPNVRITAPGDVDYFMEDMDVPAEEFAKQCAQ